MEAAKDNTLHPSVSLFSGILLALFVFSLALMQVILLFGEGRNIASTSQGGLILSILSVVAYATGEITLFPRARRKTLFALSYFMTFSLLAMLFFHFVTTADFTFLFSADGETARSLLLSEGFRLCSFNAVALLVRIAVEIARYVKSVLRG
jgi:hypothetical protein